MASREGFLTQEQRETLKVASQSVDILSSSPKSPSGFMSEHHAKSPRGGMPGINVKHVRRTHSGKLGRAKKGIFLSTFSNCLFVCVYNRVISFCVMVIVESYLFYIVVKLVDNPIQFAVYWSSCRLVGASCPPPKMIDNKCNLYV